MAPSAAAAAGAAAADRAKPRWCAGERAVAVAAVLVAASVGCSSAAGDLATDGACVGLVCEVAQNHEDAAGDEDHTLLALRHSVKTGHSRPTDPAERFMEREFAENLGKSEAEQREEVEDDYFPKGDASQVISELPAAGRGPSQTTPPPGIARNATLYGQCLCGDGLESVTLWPDGDMASAVTVRNDEVQWVQWGFPVSKMSWMCSGMTRVKETQVNLQSSQWLSIRLYQHTRDDWGCSRKLTGVVHMNTWDRTDYVGSIPFTTGTEGYMCFKIPALLRTHKGTLIAFSEARKVTCSDFAATDLVYKRSTDGGQTWGKLSVLVEVTEQDQQRTGLCGRPLVLGNVAPVQISLNAKHHPGRILAPYSRNNFKAWITYSDDDGETWQGDREIPDMTVTDPGVPYADAQPDCDRGMSHFGFKVDFVDEMNPVSVVRFLHQLCDHAMFPYNDDSWSKKLTGPWQWIGTGPPGSLELTSERIIVPCYHSYIRGLEGHGALPVSQLYNNFALGHTMISDDGGDTWSVSYDWPAAHGANENQMVQLDDGTIVANSRSLATGSPQWRLQSRSSDDGESFSATELTTIPQPFNGCQGSTFMHKNGTALVASPDPPPSQAWVQQAVNLMGCSANLTGRRSLTVWRSTDGLLSYPYKAIVDPGLSAQTSLQIFDGKFVVLYEQADEEPLFTVKSKLQHKALGDLKVLLPSRFVYRELTGLDFVADEPHQRPTPSGYGSFGSY